MLMSVCLTNDSQVETSVTNLRYTSTTANTTINNGTTNLKQRSHETGINYFYPKYSCSDLCQVKTS